MQKFSDVICVRKLFHLLRTNIKDPSTESQTVRMATHPRTQTSTHRRVHGLLTAIDVFFSRAWFPDELQDEIRVAVLAIFMGQPVPSIMQGKKTCGLRHRMGWTLYAD